MAISFSREEPSMRAAVGWSILLGAMLFVASPEDDKIARTGPATEKRFPPLKVPPGFRATLFACDPLIEYPSVIAAGPRAGAVFVAIDYMTGLGTEIVRRDEIRLVEDTDADGYADKATVHASGFNSIQGMAYQDGRLHVMHAPFLSVLCDADADGKMVQRRDLLVGLGLPPEQNPTRLHCANGVVVGHDGWLYLALGDNGCKVDRPEGDRLVLEGGGILRCRPDGRDLHVFATGLRNIYDLALDAELNVFVRDNENDGGTYMIRVCHSFFGADHGYPYLYEERPDEALAPLADLGLGSSAGGACYLETAYPAEYRGNLFFCEWGRAVMRYQPRRAGAGFAPLKEIEFAAAAAADPYGFKPTDIVVQRDGSLLVSDWADDQRPKRGRGRIYRIEATAGNSNATAVTAVPPAELDGALARLDSESYWDRLDAQGFIERAGTKGLAATRRALETKRLGMRARLHAIWIIAKSGETKAMSELLKLAESDPDARVQAQAVRAIADLGDPILARHRLNAGPGDADLAARLAALPTNREPAVLLEVILALGRLQWARAPAWLRKTLTQPDATLVHAAMQTLRRAGNWPEVLKLLDEPESSPMRPIALRAVAERFDPTVVDGLIQRLQTEGDPARRRQLADALTRVHKKPGPWMYWGYRPAPRPANTTAWERTAAIERALDQVLADADRNVRAAILKRMQREKIPTSVATLTQWLHEERDSACAAMILESVKAHPADATREPLAEVVRDKEQASTNRLTALGMFSSGLNETSEGRLLELAGSVEDGPVLAELLRQLGKRPRLSSVPLLLKKATSLVAPVRAAVAETLAELKANEGNDPVRRMLDDPDAGVRRAAAAAAGTLAIKSAAEALLSRTHDADAAVRRASLDSLRLIQEKRVVPRAVEALTDAETQTAALRCIGELGNPGQAKAVFELAKRNPSAEVLPVVARLLRDWAEKEKDPDLWLKLAELQSSSGVLLDWTVAGPFGPDQASPLIKALGTPTQGASRPPPTGPKSAARWDAVFAAGPEAAVILKTNKTFTDGQVWIAHTSLSLNEPTVVQFLASSNVTLKVWLNGRRIYQRNEARPYQPNSDRFDATLDKGVNVVLVELSALRTETRFHIGFRRKSVTADHERLTQAALTRTGHPERGRLLFFNVAKSQCLKCHRLGEQGEKIGPELTGVGKRFGRIHIIESILEPSRTIAPSFETLTVALKDGRSLSGVRVAESADRLTLGDRDGKKHDIAKTDIEARRTDAQSIMPEGLEKPFTTDEFVDLVAFLVSQK
jgi:putative membrane-bound dehydrogenase-like protein